MNGNNLSRIESPDVFKEYDSIEKINEEKFDYSNLIVEDVLDKNTILHETTTNSEKSFESEDTIIKMLESNDDEHIDDVEESEQNCDALADVLKSFQPSSSKDQSILKSSITINEPPKKKLHIDNEQIELDDKTHFQTNDNQLNINGINYEINSFNDYMRMKIDKLNHQVNSKKTKQIEQVSNIFQGYSVFVNGYTEPPALVIRDLITAHGGEYHCYYLHRKTSFIIATSIANSKIPKIREKEIFIKSEWITESIAAGKVLNYHDFLIYEKGAKEQNQMQQFLKQNFDLPKNKSEFLDAKNPEFIKNYYSRSRLHLISTLAQDMKDFVANLKLKGKLIEKDFDEQELKQIGNNENILNENIIFHIDLDCFFVSVALRNRNDLKDKPIAITHSKGTTSNSMSEIASCSYPARSYGIKNGMLVKNALELCPKLILFPYQFDDYVNVSKTIYEILASYTLEIRAVSCDEMYINATKLCEQFQISNPCQLAEHIRSIIKKKTGCPASIGIGPTSLLSRLATRHAKPNGIYWVENKKIDEFIKKEKINNIPGIGYQIIEKLKSCFGNIENCEQLQQYSEKDLANIFGSKLATKIFKQCRGKEEDVEDFWKTQIRKSVSCDINYGIRFDKKCEVFQLIKTISEELEKKLKNCEMLAGCLTLKLMIRSPNAPIETAKFMGHGICDSFTKTSNFINATTKSETLTNEAIKLYRKFDPKVEDLRGIGITCGKLIIKHRKNTLNAVEKMFCKVKKTNEDIKDKNEKKEEDEDEDGMNDKITEDLPKVEDNFNSNKKLKNIPNPQDLKADAEIRIPEYLRTSEFQMQKDLNKLKLGSVSFEKSDEIKNQFFEICKNEPTEDSVHIIYTFFIALLATGKLNSLKQYFQIFYEITENSSETNTNWFEAANNIKIKIEEESASIFEFPIMIIASNYIDKTKTEKNTFKNQKYSKNINNLIKKVNVCDTSKINDKK